MNKISDYVTVIESRRADRGMTIRALSQKSGIKENSLYNALEGKRKLKADELLAVSSVLNLKLEDFKAEAEEVEQTEAI